MQVVINTFKGAYIYIYIYIYIVIELRDDITHKLCVTRWIIVSVPKRNQPRWPVRVIRVECGISGTGHFSSDSPLDEVPHGFDLFLGLRSWALVHFRAGIFGGSNCVMTKTSRKSYNDFVWLYMTLLYDIVCYMFNCLALYERQNRRLAAF